MHGMDEACRYLRASHALREALDIPRGASLAAIPLGNGEHNANFAFDHPVTGARYVLRMNYASQLGLREQASYEHGALRALAVSRRAPSTSMKPEASWTGAFRSSGSAQGACSISSATTIFRRQRKAWPTFIAFPFPTNAR